jgi:uncharacterized protein
MRQFVLFALLLAGPVFASPDNVGRFERAVAAYHAGQFRTARTEFKELANQGSAIAETMLGTMYAEGQGVKPDAATAVIYFYRAAHRGYAPAQLALSDAFAKGRGTDPSPVAAYKWARLAQVRGHGATAEASKATVAKLAETITPEQRRKADRAVLNWRPWSTSTR